MSFLDFANSQGYASNWGANGTPLGYGRPPVAKPAMSTGISKEERQLLKSHQDTFDLNVTPEQLASAACAHKTEDGNYYDVVPVPGAEPGTLMCKTCKATFNPDVVTPEYVDHAKDMILNVLQTMKLIGLDLSNDVIRQYFSMIPYLERIPLLYKMITASFDRYTNYTPLQQAKGPSAFSLYQEMINGSTPLYSGGGWGAAQAPAWGTTGWNSGSSFQYIYTFINQGQYQNALSALQTVPPQNQTAEWYYLSAMSFAGIGNNSMAAQCASQAAQMEPMNAMYKQLAMQYGYGATATTPFTAQQQQMTGGNPMYEQKPMNNITLPGTTTTDQSNQSGQTQTVNVKEQVQL